MSYEVAGLGEPTTFDDGASVLLAGDSPLTDQRLLDAVAPDDGEQAIVITMNMNPGQIADELQDRGADPEQVGIIDCTSTGVDIDGADVRELNSPGDLTGISLEFAKLLDGEDEEAVGPVRVGFASVSTALMYAELRTVFRFLHVFTARISSGGMLGVFSMDPAMHEEKAYNTVRAVFDAEAKVTEEEPELRGTGFQR